MNQDIELMRGLLLWLADAETWEVSYCEKQVGLKPDGSVDKVGMYNIWPGTSLEEGDYEVVCFRTLPPYIVQPIPGRESTRDQFLWYGRLTPQPRPGSNTLSDTETIKPRISSSTSLIHTSRQVTRRGGTGWDETSSKSVTT